MVGLKVRWALAAVLFVAASCTSIFDSYFPDSVEYLQSQIDLSAELGGKPVASMTMRYLPSSASHPTDLLVIVASTTDGGTRVLFYDPSSLSKVASFTGDQLTAVNLGVAPQLNLIAQDATAIYTGEVTYTFPGPIIGPVTLPSAIPSSSDLAGFVATYAGVGVTIFQGQGSVLAANFASNYVGVPALTAINPALTLPYVSLLDAIALNSKYYLLIGSGSSASFVTGTTAVGTSDLAVQATVNPTQMDNSGGWVMAGTAVVRGHADNGTLLQAYSFSGSHLSDLRLEDNNQVFSLAFEPQGKAWYLFDSSTGKLSKNRPWW